MKISNFFIVRSIFIPLILLGSLAIATIFTHLQVKQQAQQFEDVFRTQNVKPIAELDIFNLSNNLGHLIGKFHFKCIVASNEGAIFFQKGAPGCTDSFFEAKGKIVSATRKLNIEYVLRLPPSWYYLSGGLIILQAILAITFFIISNQFEKRIFSQERKRIDDLMNQARQVAHDIRSPLAVINSSTGNEEIKRYAIERLNSIASNLLGEATNKTQSVMKIAEQIINEKRIEHSQTLFNFKIKNPVTYQCEPVLLSRILSNLINNAAEAGSNVSVILDSTTLTIQDNGSGIPQEVLIGLHEGFGITTKKNGHGMGLIHAKNEIEKMGASFHIETSSKGTKIKLSWPSSTKASALLIEDDELIRNMWKIEAHNNGIKLYSTDNAQTAFQILKNLPPEAPIFIDENLSATLKGSQLAKDIASLGYTNIYLCTGYDADEFKNLKYLKGVLSKDYPSAILTATICET